MRGEADEAGWLLGARFTIQVVPGGGDDVLAVLAGDLDAVCRAGSQRCEDAWLSSAAAFGETRDRRYRRLRANVGQRRSRSGRVVAGGQ